MAAQKISKAFYRVSIKALIFDDKGRLLVFKDRRGQWEMPGGGWEFAESLEDCLRRELMEEVGAKLASLGEIECCWRDFEDDKRGHRLRLGVRVTLKSVDFKLKNDNGEKFVEARFVAKQEFPSLPFQPSEKGVLACMDKIWPKKVKPV